MRFLPQELIRKKRDGHELAAPEMAFLTQTMADGTLADAQVGALAMAMWLRGLSTSETAALTLGMRESGVTLDWGGLDKPVLDKHSTGGVGDKVSLILAPLVAACGGVVPMISGRGLGHTGGTLDKLESIPGYCATPDLEQFRAVVRKVGCAIIGQTDQLAPADRRLYAVRDVTATVESVSLITASILSKKLAAGLDGLVMDVKVGSGAFLPSIDAAHDLARSILGVAGETGLSCRAVLTDMNQCLGRTAGNAVEVAEAVAILRGEAADLRLTDVTLALAAAMLVLGGLAEDLEQARGRCQRALADGSAAERFGQMVGELGGPSGIIDDPAFYLPRSPIQRPVYSERGGIVQAIDVRALGLAVVTLGGGRTRPEQDVDPAVGLSGVAGLGEHVEPASASSRPLVIVHARDEASAVSVARSIRAAFNIGEAAMPVPSPVLERLA